MHLWQWLITGIVAGLIARLVLRRSTIGLSGDLVLGALGGLVAGALLRYGGFTSVTDDAVHIVVAMTGAIGVIAIVHAAARLALRATRLIKPVVRNAALESALTQAGALERDVLEHFLKRKPVSRNPQEVAAENDTLGARVADRVARFGGSWTFIGMFIATLITWMLYNIQQAHSFDPYPFILLNLVLSCLAALQAPIILMSQNRQAEKDRQSAEADYAVNLKAEVEILALHAKLDELRERAWQDLREQQQHQQALLDRLEAAGLHARA